MTDEQRNLYLPILNRSGYDIKAALDIISIAYDQDQLSISGFRMLMELAPELCKRLATSLGFSTVGNLRNYMRLSDFFIPIQTLELAAAG